MNYDEYVNLVKQVFSSEAGSKLLQVLIKDYAMGNIYSDVERDTVYKLGQRDLVLDLMYTFNKDSTKEFDYLGDI